MKKFTCLLCAVCGCFFIFQTCQKDSGFHEEKTNENISGSRDTLYDQYVVAVAKSIAESLKDKNFRTLLKAEALKKTDGDCEVIFNKFTDKLAENNQVKILNTLKDCKLKSASSSYVVLDKYPKLQIAVRAGAEKWDADNYHPYVVYLTSNYDEKKTKQVAAIGPDGKTVLLDATKEPDFPVIVIDKNERSDVRGEILERYLVKDKKTTVVNDVPVKASAAVVSGFSVFKAVQTAGSLGVNLSWTYTTTYPTWSTEGMFNIYRDDLSGNGFVLIASKYSWDATYNDIINILPSKTYYYQIRALVNSGYLETAYVNVLVGPLGDLMKSLSVDNIGPNTMELTWLINNQANWTNLTLERYSGLNTTYQFVANLPVATVHYVDHLMNAVPAFADKYRYRFTATTSLSTASQNFYCEEYLGNRVDGKPLYVKRIQFNSFSDMRFYEPWTRGDPEIRLTVKNYNTKVGAQTICENSSLGGESSAGWNCDLNVFSWDKKRDGDVLTFALNEEDEGMSAPITISLGSVLKLPKVLGINVTLNADVKTTIPAKDGDDYIGTGYLYYWDNAAGTNVQCGGRCKLTVKTFNE